MGKKTKTLIRVVLDTNILVSALLFKGNVSEIVSWWKEGKIVPLVSKETFDEFVKVLCYPKFSLSEHEIEAILKDEVLPYFEVITIKTQERSGCRDPQDEKFIQCALSGNAQFLVTGDKDLHALIRWKSIKILTWAEFAKKV